MEIEKSEWDALNKKVIGKTLEYIASLKVSQELHKFVVTREQLLAMGIHPKHADYIIAQRDKRVK